MKLIFDKDGLPLVVDLPLGYEILFWGKYREQKDKRFPHDGFAVVIARTEALERGDQELFENAFVGFCGIKGGDIVFFQSWHCHKYEAGGMLEFLKSSSSLDDEPNIFWRPPGHRRKSSLRTMFKSICFEEEKFFK